MTLSHISTVSNQWAVRPDDQRFLSMDALFQHVNTRKVASNVHDVAAEHLLIRPGKSGDSLYLGARQGNDDPRNLGKMTHWTFSQLCQRAGAPAGYLRSLPAPLAATALQWSMENDMDAGDAKVLTWGHNGSSEVGAITSPSYGRIWDADVVNAVMNRLDLNEWQIPGASYASRDPKRATTLYASDRDVFLFLVNESRPITVRDAGKETTLFRGFYIQNSEALAGSFVIATMLYEYVCDNRNIWGPRDFKEIRIRHTSGAPHRFIAEADPQLSAYAQASDKPIVEAITAASTKEVGKDRKSVLEWMKARGFTVKLAGDAFDSAEENGRNPRTPWGLAWGVTDVAHNITHTNTRAALERKAGDLIDHAA